jgi:hypothetical protein
MPEIDWNESLIGCPILFIFIIDRSGSMSWNNNYKMNTTNDALAYFLKCLPLNA